MLLDNLRASVISQLRHKSITLCSEWSSRFRVMGKPFAGPYSILHHPWAKDMLDCNRDWVGPKSSQMGYTETALNRCFFTIDIKKLDVMYVLPKQDPDASDFSAARFTPALELSPHLRNMFSDANNVGHKRAGNVNLYVRGAMSRSGVKSVSTGLMIFDELDEMPERNVELALHRTSGQLESQIIMISTPTIPDFGIALAYKTTNQQHYFFKCPLCSRHTELTYPECIVITADSFNDPRINESHYICKECKGVLHNDAKPEFMAGGEWVKSCNFDSAVDGFHIHHMYSMAKAGLPAVFAAAALKSKLNPASEQEFNNSCLGREHVVEGSRVEMSTLKNLSKGSSRNEIPTNRNRLRVMGVDVGSFCHYEIGEYVFEKGLTTDLNALSTYVQLTHGKVQHFEELDKLMRDYQIYLAVIDANPERRKVVEFAARFPGHVYMCFYGNNLRGSDCVVNKDAGSISVDRTCWLDVSMGRFNSGRIILPHDTLDEYKENVHALIRKYERDAHDNPVGVWVNVGPDHFGHARNYAEIALPLAASLLSNRDIASFL